MLLGKHPRDVGLLGRQHDRRSGGTTYGNTFIYRGTVPPQTLAQSNPLKYQDLTEHEGTHVKQYETLGIGMVLYFPAELPSTVISKLTGAQEGCWNIFEITADRQKGGYTNC